MQKVVWGLAGVSLLALMFALGHSFRPDPPPPPTPIEGVVPTQPPDPVVAPPATPVSPPPLLPSVRPPVVTDPDLVRQTMKPGKTYKTILKGTIDTRGTDHHWGVKTVVNIYYMFEAVVDREIVENDGEVVVEIRHFRDVRSIKVDTELEDVKLELGPAKYPVLIGLAAIYPPAAGATRALDGVSLKPVLGLLGQLGIDPLKISGQSEKIFKMYTQLDTLTGKSVRLVYSNRPGDTGVNRFEAVTGPVTESEEFLHRHSAVLSDALLFPERTRKPGESWEVLGSAFGNLIDPGLRAAVAGKVVVRRGGEVRYGERPVTELVVVDGRLELLSRNPGEGQVGWFEPRGTLLFSLQDQVVVQGVLSGRGQLDRVSRGLLFKSELRQEPKVSVRYTCEVTDTPKGGKP